MQHTYIQTIVLAILLGIASYTLAKRLRVPAILFYLVAGVAFGPMGLHVLNANTLGSGLPTLIEIAMAIILFEGGISLPSQGFKAAPLAIRRILMVSIPLTGLGGAVLAHYIVGLSWKISIIFGALILVTGPTVVGPLLKSIALSQRLEIVLRYEAIWGDCIGVLLSALALELVPLSDFSSLGVIGISFFSRLLVGIAIGLGSGLIIARTILPWVSRLGDPALPGMVALAGALGIFWGSNRLAASSGPLAVAVAGFTLSYLKAESLQDIRHFKDQVAMLFISTLFVLLSSAIDPLKHLSIIPPILIVAALMGAIVRPASIMLALINTRLDRNEKMYISLVGPRGIIAIATASYASFALSGYDNEMFVLLTMTFVIIFLSGCVATLFGGVFARILKVSITPYQSGIIFVGVNPVSMALAGFAKQYVPVRLVDTNQLSCRLAEKEGFETVCGSALDDELYSIAAEEGFRRALIMTPNDALNVLILRHSQAHFGINNSFRVLPKQSDAPPITDSPSSRHVAFSTGFHFMHALESLAKGEAEMKVIHPKEVGDQVAFPLLEPTGYGIKLVRAGRKPKGEALYLIPSLPVPPLPKNKDNRKT